VFAILIALPLGIFQAVKRNSIGDNIATSAAFILYSKIKEENEKRNT